MWKEEFEIIDFHSHILPGVDDGAKDLETSVKMLSLMSQQGVDKVVSTSHYYSHFEDIASYIKRRNDALYNLEKHINEHDLFLPEIIPAAEVRLYSELSRDPDLGMLCIGDTKNILVEMPYMKWSDWMYNEIYSIASKGYTPIVAHLERYLDTVSVKTITDKLLSLGVLVQCNAEAFSDWKERRFVKKLIKHGRLTVIGTDCHSMKTRLPNINIALEYLSKKFGDEMIKAVMNNASLLIGAK